MNCPNCGQMNENDAAFCFNCGASLAAQPETAPVAQEQPAAAQPQVIINNNTPGMVPGMVYEVSGGNKTLRCIAFVFSLIHTIALG